MNELQLNWLMPWHSIDYFHTRWQTIILRQFENLHRRIYTHERQCDILYRHIVCCWRCWRWFILNGHIKRDARIEFYWNKCTRTHKPLIHLSQTHKCENLSNASTCLTCVFSLSLFQRRPNRLDIHLISVALSAISLAHTWTAYLTVSDEWVCFFPLGWPFNFSSFYSLGGECRMRP